VELPLPQQQQLEHPKHRRTGAKVPSLCLSKFTVAPIIGGELLVFSDNNGASSSSLE